MSLTKGYVNYTVYKKWTDQGSFYVTRLNQNANYEVISKLRHDAHSFLYAGTVLYQLITLKASGKPLKTRLVTYKDLLTGKLFRLMTNLF